MASRANASMRIDTAELKNFAKGLRLVDRSLYLKMNKKIRVAAQVVADDAKARASWSTKIPATIRVRGGLARLSVVAGKGVPYAVPYEYGGKKMAKGTFKHPVYAAVGSARYEDKGSWPTERTRPFLVPALAAHRTEVMEAMVIAVNETIDEALAKGHAL